MSANSHLHHVGDADEAEPVFGWQLLILVLLSKQASKCVKQAGRTATGLAPWPEPENLD